MTDLKIRPTDSWVETDYTLVAPHGLPALGALGRWAHRAPGDYWDFLGQPQARIVPDAMPLLPLLSVMISWQAQSDQWFGGEERPTLVTMQRALNLLTLNEFSGPLPVVRPTSAGGVQFEWSDGPNEFEIEMLSDGRVVTMIDDGAQIFTDETEDLRSEAIRRVLKIVQSH